MKKIILTVAAFLAIASNVNTASAATTSMYDLGVFVGATTSLSPSATNFTLGVDALYKFDADMGLGIFWRMPLVSGVTSMDLGAEYKMWLNSVAPGLNWNLKAGLSGVGSGGIGFLVAAGLGYDYALAESFKIGAGVDFDLAIASGTTAFALQYGANFTYSF